MLRIRNLAVLGGVCAIGACAVTPDTALMPDNVPVLYAEPEEQPTVELTCEGMQLEFAYLNSGLGDYPTDSPPPDTRTLSERAGEKIEDLIMDALTDQIDPAIQAYRILTDAGETERKLANAKRRGLIRRAYVMGHMDAEDCPRDENTIMITARLAEGDVIEMREAESETLTAAIDGPPVRDVDVQLANAPPTQEKPVDIEVEYVIVIELERAPEMIELAEADIAAKPPMLPPKDIENEVRDLAVPDLFETPWKEGEEPAAPPESDVPIAEMRSKVGAG